jgi:hypothetical protein
MENGKKLIHSFNHIDCSPGNFEGLTKREYFAGLAMESLLKATCIKEETLISKIRRLLGLKGWKVNNNINYQNVAKESTKIADELLKQLSND